MSVSSVPALRLAGVSKRFGKTVALSDVDLSVGADELVVILGPTGAGKTTLLRTVAGLETPDTGDILFGETSVVSWPPAHRDVALVFQNFSLYPDWTVRENLVFPLRAPGRRFSETEITERIAWAADLLKIEYLLDRPTPRLSGGEMQRVAIGRAIVRRPRLFLMDEPLTNLDAKLRESLRVELVALHRALGVPMLYVTHDQVEAMSMADRIVVLDNGRILQTGTPEAVYRRPVSPAVARQLGHPPINLIPVRSGANGWEAYNGTWVLAGDAPSGANAVVGIRPEDVAPVGGSAPGIVRVVEHAGPERILVVAFAGMEIRLLVSKAFAAHPGDTVYPCLTPDRTMVWYVGTRSDGSAKSVP
ncbi:MAG: ABC transporter ATP-binding protein [candidate division Zixibacteria bacterium]|nr:ABC transporter ATP-binding protein [candidate division Zixibacteria bacterium]